MSLVDRAIAAGASFIAARPMLVDSLVAFAQRRPYFHIHGPDGSVYMSRWWLMPRFMLCVNSKTQALEPKAWHLPLWRWLAPLSIRLHHIAQPDQDRELHDHPFDYRTLILRGWYVEENVFGEFTDRLTGDTARARAQTFHRIAHVSGGGVWTLFVCHPRINEWGFLVGGRKVHWRTYLGLDSGADA